MRNGSSVPLRVRRLGLHTQKQAVAVMRTDCHVCRSEGLSARSQLVISTADRSIQAELLQVESALLAENQIGLSEAAWTLLGVGEGDEVRIGHAFPPSSLRHVRARLFGSRFSRADLDDIIRDVIAGRYTDVHLSSFLTATAAAPLDEQETISLTGAMMSAGDRLEWGEQVVVDKHCIGGLPGNRTTPIVVAIVAACGLMMPKTSSRAITSPAGTADTMETMTDVELDISRIRRVVEEEGGCIVWGGAVHLSPADDVFVRIERELDIDVEGQMIASVLSKKVAAGSSHVVIDIPVGPTAKIRDTRTADALAARMEAIGQHFGLFVSCIQTDGSQPVGRGIGPALEAYDVMAVLSNETDAPEDLRARAVRLAGLVLEMGGAAAKGVGPALALQTLRSGKAWEKFQRICEAQGGMRTPPRSRHQFVVEAAAGGVVSALDNRAIARVARLAGAPRSAAAGIRMLVRLDETVERGQPLLQIHAETAGELGYAHEFAERSAPLVRLK
jgi:thymidine phosphorylase